MTIYSHEWELLASLVQRNVVDKAPDTTISTSLLARLLERATRANELEDQIESLLDQLDEARADISYLEDMHTIDY